MMPAVKRPRITKEDSRAPCKYGSKCYRKNPDHLKRFKHEEGSCKWKDSGAKRSETSTKPRSERSTSNIGAVWPDRSPAAEGDSGVDIKETLKRKCLAEMPEDFYDFWQFCQSLNSRSPEDALYETLGLRLVGPFDVLSGKLNDSRVRDADGFLRHWRYYFDPPEMQTVIRGDDATMYHLGYFRDDPKRLPVFVASNAAKEGCKISRVAGNLFAAISKEIAAALGKAYDEKKRSELKKLNGALVEFAEAKRHATDEASKKRPEPLAATFHGAGLVVPYDPKTEVGYRPLPVSNAKLKAILTKISSSPTEEARAKNMIELREIITNVHMANDECDYGMGLELGLDLFCFGCPKLHSVLLHILTMAYSLLDREEYAKILTAHLRRRERGLDLSAIDA